jgi:hypothetical protein
MPINSQLREATIYTCKFMLTNLSIRSFDHATELQTCASMYRSLSSKTEFWELSSPIGLKTINVMLSPFN